MLERSKENYKYLKEKLEKCLDFDYNNILKSLSNNVVCVGTGSSYSTAYLFAKILRNVFNKNAIAMTPRQLLNEKSMKNNSIIIFSYSGTSKDIIYIRKKFSNNILICGRDLEEFENQENIFSYYTGVKYEKGNVLYENVLIPVTILMKNIKNFKKIIKYEIEDLENTFFSNLNLLKKAKNVAVFSGDFCETATLSFCNKILETGIMHFDYYEKKDFSHGQYIYFLNNRYDSIIYFKQKKVSEYEKSLLEYLQKTKINIILIESDFNSFEAEYDLIFKANKLFNCILQTRKLKNKDIKNGERLYKYEGDFS